MNTEQFRAIAQTYAARCDQLAGMDRCDTYTAASTINACADIIDHLRGESHEIKGFTSKKVSVTLELFEHDAREMAKKMREIALKEKMDPWEIRSVKFLAKILEDATK